MKRLLGLVVAGALFAACGGGTKSSTNGTTTVAGQNANKSNDATQSSGTAAAHQHDATAIDTTPFNK